MTDEEKISEEKKKIAFIDTASTIHPNTLEDDLNYYENFLIPGLQEQIEKKDKIIQAMAIELYNYANLGKMKICPAEQDNGNYDLNMCKMNLSERNCVNCIIEYFEKEGK